MVATQAVIQAYCAWLFAGDYHVWLVGLSREESYPLEQEPGWSRLHVGVYHVFTQEVAMLERLVVRGLMQGAEQVGWEQVHGCMLCAGKETT